MAPSKESFRLSTQGASFFYGEAANGPLNMAMLALFPQPDRLQEPARAHGRADAQVEYTPARIVPPATAQKRRRTERMKHGIAEAEDDPLTACQTCLLLTRFSPRNSSICESRYHRVIGRFRS